MGLLDTIGSWFGGSGSDVKDVLGSAGALFNAYNESSHNNDYLDALRGAAQYDYDNQKANRDAYIAYLQQSNAAANSAAAARSSAARQNAANQLKALKKSAANLKTGYAKAIGMLDPYVQAGAQSAPIMSALYGKLLGNFDQVAGQVFNPQALANLAAPKSTFAQNIPIPDYMRPK